MRQTLRGLTVAAFVMGVCSASEARASTGPGVSHIGRLLQAASTGSACVTTTGTAAAHLPDGTILRGRVITFSSTTCPRGSAGSASSAAAHSPRALRFSHMLPSRCDLQRAAASGGVSPSYYKLASKPVTCTNGQSLFIDNVLGANGNGFDRTYFYDGEVGGVVYADVTLACGNVTGCEQQEDVSSTSIDYFTSVDLYWSSQAAGSISAFCF